MKTKIKNEKSNHTHVIFCLNRLHGYIKKINSEIKQLDLVPMCSYFINRLNF